MKSTQALVIVVGVFTTIAGAPQKYQVTFQDVKDYIQPILYQKLLRSPGDSAVVQQAKTVVSEYLVDSLLESVLETDPNQEDHARQTMITVSNPISSISLANITGPSQEHVIGQVDRIIQNVNEYNITGIVDQALRINAPAPVQQLVNGIMNLVLCNPLNRLWNRCPGGGGLLGGRRR